MEQNEFYKSLIEQSPDAMIFADVSGRIQLWNSGAEAVFGFTSDEALGQSLDIIVPEELRAAHWSSFERAMKEGHTKYGRKVMTTRSIRKNGDRIYVNLSFSIILDNTSQSIGTLALARDFTARYLEEKMLRKKISELERGK